MLVGVVWAALGGVSFERTPFDVCGPLPERAAYHTELALWPPGATRCTVSLPAGATRERVTVPWREWLGVLVLAVAAGLAMGAVTGLGRRTPLAAGSSALVLAAVAIWFA